MISRGEASKAQAFPMELKYTRARTYIVTIVLIMLNVLVPWAFHQFNLAGATFLPMHVFVLAAGLMFGWQVGLTVGLATPLASYAMSGMPALPILPQVLLELSTYGAVSGILRQKFNLRVVWSLMVAMAAGRLALLLAIVIASLTLGSSFSPTGVETGPVAAVWSAIRQGWPGIVAQLIAIPAVVRLATNLWQKKQQGN